MVAGSGRAKSGMPAQVVVVGWDVPNMVCGTAVAVFFRTTACCAYCVVLGDWFIPGAAHKDKFAYMGDKHRNLLQVPSILSGPASIIGDEEGF